MPLAALLTEARARRLDEVLARRTRYVTVILENLNHPHNASAVLRTCDAMGIQDVQVIEDRNAFSPVKGVSQAAHKWLTLRRYGLDPAAGASAARRCAADLQARGYRIAVTSPHRSSVSIEELPVDQPIAIAFGAEKLGVSEELAAAADYRVVVPMHGFSESYNISVCAALCLQELTRRARGKVPSWALTEAERAELRDEWVRKSVRNAGAVERLMRLRNLTATR